MRAETLHPYVSSVSPHLERRAREGTDYLGYFEWLHRDAAQRRPFLSLSFSLCHSRAKRRNPVFFLLTPHSNPATTESAPFSRFPFLQKGRGSGVRSETQIAAGTAVRGKNRAAKIEH